MAKNDINTRVEKEFPSAQINWLITTLQPPKGIKKEGAKFEK